ncbi:hypothetical protein JW935_19080 [candidate division KSB1 bacterium]|nr:hypothetical protein [candidate division KSB1 bacterium]
MSRMIIFAFILSGLLWTACEKTEGGGSGSLEPGTGDPEIIEGYICGWVSNNRPEKIDNSFVQDERVYLWLSWGNVTGKHTVRVIWLDPEDDVVSDQEESFNSKTGKTITHFYIDTTSTAPVGRWIAEVHIDGKFVCSYAFWMYEE